MKCQEKGIGSKSECVDYLRSIFSKLSKDQLVVENEEVSMPDDKELEYKVKYEDDEQEGSLSVKISWSNSEEEEEEEEEKEED